MSKNKPFNVTLDNGKEVTVQGEKDNSYSVYGGQNYESISDIKSDSNLNGNTPNVPDFLNNKDQQYESLIRNQQQKAS